MNKKETKDYSIFIHILFFGIIGFAAFAFFTLGGKKDINTIVKNTEVLYQEKIDNTGKVTLKKAITTNQKIPTFENYKYTYKYNLKVQNSPERIIFKVPIPSDEKEKQYITESKLTPQPTRTYNDGVNNIAEYTINKPHSGIYSIVLEGNAKVRTYDLQTAKSINRNNEKTKNLSRYLQPERLIESNDIVIKNIASRIKGNSQEEIVQKVYEYLQDNFKYEIIPENIGAKRAIELKRGKCSEYSAVMTAILRAKKIPARIVGGNIAQENDIKHNWVEVYYDKYGWVAVDPTDQGVNVNIYHNGKLLKQEKQLSSDKINMKYITSSRNEFTPWSISYSVSQRANGNVSVEEILKIQKL